MLLVQVLGCMPVDDPLESTQQEVIGGTPTPAGMYPQVGALVTASFGFMCTGTLIAPDVVLTAAHCVEPLFLGGEVPGFTLELDANLATPAQIVRGVRMMQHPNFDINVDTGTGVARFYDIGLLWLQAPITDVLPAILPSPDEVTTFLTQGNELEIVGYGLTDTQGFEAGVKHHGVADLVVLGDWELLIARPGQQQNCNGDSGGPAFVGANDGIRLVGVVSRAPDTNPTCDHGGIDTRADAYMDWIAANVDLPCIGEACTGGGGPSGSCTVAVAAGTRTPSSSTTAWVVAGLALVVLQRRRRRRR